LKAANELASLGPMEGKGITRITSPPKNPPKTRKAPKIMIEIRAHRFRRKIPIAVETPQIEGRTRNATPRKTPTLAPGALIAALELPETANTTAISIPEAKASSEPKRARIPTKMTEIERFIASPLQQLTSARTGIDHERIKPHIGLDGKAWRELNMCLAARAELVRTHQSRSRFAQ
jgi:hypothetical protein